MEKYSEYKDCSIPWIKEIPEEWEEVQMRKLLSLVSEKNHPEATLLSVTREQGVIVRNKESKEDNHNFIPEDLSGYKYVRKGQFVINKMKSWQGSYGVSNYDGIVSPAYYVCDLNFDNKEFFSRALRSKAYLNFFIQYSKGIRVDQWDLSTIALKNLPFLIPKKDEQSAIVSYLDVATAKMDKFVTKKEQEIELLEKLKQRIIADAVTKGLDPNAEMVPCDIPWIKQIPKGWKKVSFGTICKEKSLIGYEKEELLSVFLDKGVVRFNDVEKKRTNTTSLDLSKYQLVEPGDFVLNNQQAWRGSVGVSSIRGIVSPAYIILSLSNLLEPDFANLMFRSYPIVAHYCICSKGVGSIQRNLYLAILKRRYLYIPSREEQKVIVSFIKSKCEKIDKLQAGLQQEIEKVKQYKQRLISDVVTGQIKVC
ncbi:MAG: restriction endonuclease subunit S [Paludibacteraceae bacterium]|nr:restriction endonuclease subunit S [Paludibacteraceae bacterium]